MLGLRLNFVLNRAFPERAVCCLLQHYCKTGSWGGTCRQVHSWRLSQSHSSLVLPKLFTQAVQGSGCSVGGLPGTPYYILVYQTMSVSPHMHSMVVCQCFPQHTGPLWKQKRSKQLWKRVGLQWNPWGLWSTSSAPQGQFPFVTLEMDRSLATSGLHLSFR